MGQKKITAVSLALRLIKSWICQMYDYILEDSKKKDENETDSRNY